MIDQAARGGFHKLEEQERGRDTHGQALTEITNAIRRLMTPLQSKNRPVGFMLPQRPGLQS